MVSALSHRVKASLLYQGSCLDSPSGVFSMEEMILYRSMWTRPLLISQLLSPGERSVHNTLD